MNISTNFDHLKMLLTRSLNDSPWVMRFVTHQPIYPVFGIPLLEEPHYFCDECHSGFHRLTGVQTHQASDRCNGQSYHHRLWSADPWDLIAE
jgi:hypothetical protein